MKTSSQATMQLQHQPLPHPTPTKNLNLFNAASNVVQMITTSLKMIVAGNNGIAILKRLPTVMVWLTSSTHPLLQPPPMQLIFSIVSKSSCTVSLNNAFKQPYSVFEQCLQTTKCKHIVQLHEHSWDAQKVYANLPLKRRKRKNWDFFVKLGLFRKIKNFFPKN